MITLDLFESASNNNDPKQLGRVEKPAIAGTVKTAKSGYYPKPADPVKKLAEPTNKFDKVTKEGVAEGFQDEDPLELSSDYALYIANTGRKMMKQLTDLAKKIQTDSTAAQNAKRWNLGDYMHQHHEHDDMSAINQVLEEYGVGGFFDQNLYELLANWSSQGAEYVNTWKQYSGDVIKNSTRRPPGAQSVHEQGVAEVSFDNASPMTKDSVKQDRIRSLKNLIAIAKEKGRQLRVQELELELKKLQGVAEAQPEPEQQQMDANRRAALSREREPAGSEKIDAQLAQQHAQRQEYEKTGKFWLKQKDTQQHISDAYTGKAAANAAALELLKKQPELRGNLLITAYGPGESQGVKEEIKLPYPEGSENLGRANMELLIRAYNTPTSPRTTLSFGNKSVELDRDDIEAIAEYYDDKLPTNEARWNFIRAVMNNYDNFQTMLNKIGRRSAVAVRQPGLFQEANKKKDDDDLGAVKDVALQRAISKAKADFPTAGSGLEALAQDFMKSQEQDRRDFEQLQTAKTRHDQLLSQISKVDNEQAQEINDLENQNSVMSQRLQQLQNVNSELEKKLSSMTGRREKRQTTKATTGSSTASTVSVPTVVAPKPAAKTRIKKQSAPKSKAIKVRPSAAISSVATQLAPQAAPQLPAPDAGDVLPPMFRTAVSPELQRGKETAVDTEFRDMPAMRGTAPQATAENQDKNKPEMDYDDPRWDAMVSRVGKLAKAGPLKTVWDPVKRVYKNVPADDKKPVKEQEPSVQGREAIKTVSDWAERLRVAHELQKDPRIMADAEAKAAVQQRVRELLKHGIQQGYVK